MVLVVNFTVTFAPDSFRANYDRHVLKANYCMASSTLLPPKTAKFFSIIKSTTIEFLPFPTNSTLIAQEILKSPSCDAGIEHYIPSLLYIELAISFLIGRKRTVNFRNQRL